jgi:hypothetical protein
MRTEHGSPPALRFDDVLVVIVRGCLQRFGVQGNTCDIATRNRRQILALTDFVDGHPAIRDGLHVVRAALLDVGSQEAIGDVFDELLRSLQRTHELGRKLLLEIHAPRADALLVVLQLLLFEVAPGRA